MTRIYERDTDILFAKALEHVPAFATHFLKLVEGTGSLSRVLRQTPHHGAGHRGSIDLELRTSTDMLLLVENKIDAGYSVTRSGDPQPDRYEASVAALRARGIAAASVLLAPEVYLRGSRHAHRFNHQISYEALRQVLSGEDLALLDAAILQAVTPYDPVPNSSSATFFAEYEAFARRHFPKLVIKHNPNGNGVRPTESRTIYFDVPRTLHTWGRLPRPRMSLQCRDSTAPSASVKIMLGGWGMKAGELPVPTSLSEIGGYIRPAGRSIGLVIDTPQLDTQTPFIAQMVEIEAGLEAAERLARWWNNHGEALASWA
jgi:hypothetical protein